MAEIKRGKVLSTGLRENGSDNVMYPGAYPVRPRQPGLCFGLADGGTRFPVVVMMKPCIHGYFDDSFKPCTCAPVVVTKYQKRISGPMLNRIDIHIEVPHMDYEKLSRDRIGEMSASIRISYNSIFLL